MKNCVRFSSSLLLRFLLCLALVSGAGIYASADTTWNLSHVTFGDGATAAGWFTMNPTFDNVTDWNIWVYGSSVGADFHYTPGGSNTYYPSSTFASFAANPFAQYLVLQLPASMTNAGGTIPLSFAFDCNVNGVCGGLLTGEVTTSPEPLSLLLLASGTTLVAGLRRRYGKA